MTYGCVSQTDESKKIDRQVKEAALRIRKEFPQLDHTFRNDKTTLFGGAKGYNPDGGLFSYKKNPIAVFEAKQQADAGNAIERHTNALDTFTYTYPRISYVTFATGEGAHTFGQIGKILAATHTLPRGQFNAYKPATNTAYLSTNGFSDQEVYDKMKTIILNEMRCVDEAIVHVGRREE